MKFFVLCLLSLLLGSCNKAPNTTSEEVLPSITVSEIVSDNGLAHLNVDGKAMALYGAQIRVDIFRSVDKLDWNSIEQYFALAIDLGVNCVQVSYPWAFLEPKKDQYSFDEIDRILSLANQYNLKVELLWFGSNMIGDSYTYLVPNYIVATKDYRLPREGDGGWHGLYGYTYSLILDHPSLLERETKAIKTLFNHIRVWDSKNGERHPVITCQVHNEPDALTRWRVFEKQIQNKQGSVLSEEESWKMTLNALNTLGLAVKSSSYKVATRTNVISGDGVKPFPQCQNASPKDVFALEGIDFVSFDPYKSTINEIVSEVSAYASMPGNYPLIAENRGDFANSASLILAASAYGRGYDIYDLATSKYITSNSAPPFNTEGIYNSDLSEKPHTALTKKMIKGLVAAAEDVALTSIDNFAAFNVASDTPAKSIKQNVRTQGAIIGFSTSDGSLAFLLDRGDYLVAYSTGLSTLTISGGTISEISDYQSGEVKPIVSQTIQLQGGRVYKLSYKSAGQLTSTTKTIIKS